MTLLEQLVRDVSEQKAILLDYMAAGRCQDYATYREYVGKLQAFDGIDARIKELSSALEQNDE